MFLGQFCVCLVFAELAARYPIAGAIYQWSRRVSSDPVGWMAGWLMQLGYVVSVAAIAMALVTRTGVTIEIVGVLLVVVSLFLHARRGPAVVFETNGVQGSQNGGQGGSYLWPFLASMLMAAYVMYGFDSAAELSEETGDPRRTAPRAIVRCMALSGVGGLLLILAALMAAPDLASPDLASQGIAWVVTSELGDVFGRIVLAVVAVSILSAALAISTSATRVMFSMARDGLLPFSAALSRVSPRTRTPILPGIVVGVLSIAVLLINLGQSSVFASVTSISVVIVYLAYLFVTVPRLWHRLRGTGEHDAEPGHFSLGRWGLPVNVVAVLFGLFLLVNVGWPRAAVYDPDGTGWWLQYSALIAVGVIVAVGAVAYRVTRRQAAGRPGSSPS